MVLLVSAHSAELLLLSKHVPVYFLRLFKLHFFLAKCIHCQCTIYISFYFQVNDLQKFRETFKKLKNAQYCLWETDCIFKKIINVNVVACQDGAVQLSDKIQDFPTDLK